MHDEPVDFSEVRFRNTDVRHIPRREEESGTPFWRIVGAVFTALCLFGLLQTVVAVVVIRQAVEDFNRSIEALVQDAPVFAPAPQSMQAPAPRPTAAPLPAYPGPVYARKAGLQQACIGAFVANRVEGGWSHTRQRCRRSSE